MEQSSCDSHHEQPWLGRAPSMHCMNLRFPAVNRREFLASVGAGSLMMAHRSLAQEGFTPAPKSVNRESPRISSLELLTAAPLAQMKQFYGELLGLEAVEDGRDRLTIMAGLTRLTFVQVAVEAGSPFYHFAFNIPENKIVDALKWQAARSGLIPVPDSLRDSKYPDQVVNYSHWNAHSIFFFDPAENVVEYIARHDLRNGRKGPFESRDILYASEIAFIVDDVPAIASQLTESAGIGLYRKGSDVFTALGDEWGLLLLMKRGRLLSLAAPQKKEAGIFPTMATLHGDLAKRHSIPGFPYEVTVKV